MAKCQVLALGFFSRAVLQSGGYRSNLDGAMVSMEYSKESHAVHSNAVGSKQTDCSHDPVIANWAVVSRQFSTFVVEFFEHEGNASRVVEGHASTASMFPLKRRLETVFCRRGRRAGAKTCKKAYIKYPGRETNTHIFGKGIPFVEDSDGPKRIKEWFFMNSRPILNPQVVAQEGEIKAMANPDDADTDATSVPVIFENELPLDLEHVVVVHKYTGNDPPTDVMAWEAVPASGSSTRQQVFTKPSTIRQDWWQVTFRFKKKPFVNGTLTDVEQCPVCVTDDGACETYMTYSSSAILQFFLDPRMYLKAGIITGATMLGGLITAASWGTLSTVSATAGVGIVGAILDGIQTGELSRYDTKDYFGCNIGREAIKNAETTKRPMYMVLRRHDGTNGTDYSLDFEFDSWDKDKGHWVRDQQCSVRFAQLPCEVPELEAEEKAKQVRHVPAVVKNGGPAKITKMALVHKYPPTGPDLIQWTDGLDAGGVSSPQEVRTMTNTAVRTIGKADWWTLSWLDEDDECIVKSAIDLDFMRGALRGLWRDVFERPHQVGFDILLGAIPPAIRAPLIALSVGRSMMTSERDVVTTRIANELFGSELISTLSQSRSDRNGVFTRCQLNTLDVDNAREGKPVVFEINRANGTVTIKTAKNECFANIVALRCVNTEGCRQRQDCKKLAAEGMKNAPPPRDVSIGGIFGGVSGGLSDIAGSVAGSLR
jgi:hypothetical protein